MVTDSAVATENSYLDMVGGAYEHSRTTTRSVLVDNHEAENIFPRELLKKVNKTGVEGAEPPAEPPPEPLRRTLDPVDKASTTVLFFDYVMVSDWKRFEHYGNVGAFTCTLAQQNDTHI